MNAANPLPTSETPADKRAYEPSMEEILASIRRIIADDQSLPGRGPARELEPPQANPIQPTPMHAAPMHATPAHATPTYATPIKRDLTRPVTPPERPEATVAAIPASLPMSDRPPVDRSPTPSPVPEQAVSVQDRAPIPEEPDLPVDLGMAHGPIAAPQFAMPDGPVGDDLAQPRTQAPPTFRAMPTREVVEPMQPEHRGGDRLYAETHHDPDATESEADEALYDTPIEPAAAVPDAPREKAPLFSAATDSAVGSAFNMLAASRLADNSDELMTLAREMIRPLLRSWIDDNLPSMVERMVRAEIERVARGGR